MNQSLFHRLSAILWSLLVLVVVFLAIYVSAGRYVTAHVAQWSDVILRELNARLPFALEAGELRGEWHSFTPVLVFSELQLHVPGDTAPPLRLRGGRVALDVWDSLRSRSLQPNRVVLDQLLLRAELGADGSLHFPGLAGGEGTLGRWLAEFLPNVEQLLLRDNQLDLGLPDGSRRSLDLDLDLIRDGSQWQLEGLLFGPDTETQVFIVGDALGNPLEPTDFSGDLYLEFGVNQLDAVMAMLPPGWVGNAGATSGIVDARAWISWRGGEPRVSLEVVGHELQLSAGADGAVTLPFDTLTLQAALLSGGDAWRAAISGLYLAAGERELTLPRVDLESRGNRLDVRVADASLAELNALLQVADPVPAELRDVFATLAPRGSVERLRLLVEDYEAPVQAWSLTANFGPVAVDSWQGAPGVERAAGFLSLNQDGGEVLLDGSQVSLSFPTVYEQPLRYDDLYGTVYIDWDADAVTLSSDLIRARAAEGEARALFGLSIPLTESPVGLEMDLLVGLRDSHPAHRGKYLPYFLDAALLDWLASAVGEGRVEEGAFLWRGSLKSGASDLRTVQLFFNVADTRVAFQPDWPALERLTGTVLIDDTRVSVWGESASLYGLSLEHLSAETWYDDSSGMHLGVEARGSGPAADGLRVINESPLAELTGDVFAEWQLDGVVDLDLDLRLLLAAEAPPPTVEVAARWSDVDLAIEPAGLQVDDSRGDLRYHSETGFHSRDLQGLLWGQPLQAAITPQAASPTAAVTGLDIALQGRADLARVREWLGLDLLALARGGADFDARITVLPGEIPRLDLVSTLQGVSLDLPPPWDKSSEEQRLLSLQLPLGGEPRTLNLALDDSLYLALRLPGEAGLSGLGLGFGQPVAPAEDGQARIAGALETVDWARWSSFLDQYVGDAGEATAGLLTQVEALSIGELRLFDRNLRDVTLAASQLATGWRVDVVMDWLEGSAEVSPDAQQLSLQVARLDLDGLQALELQALEDASPAGLQLPATDLRIDSLVRGGQPLGNLSLAVASVADGVAFSDIHGTLAGLVLTPEQPGQLLWRDEGQGSHSRFTGSLGFADLGESLAMLGYQRVVETASGRLDIDLRWPGTPQKPGLVDAGGSLRIDIEEGRFLEAPAATSGTLRVMSILNLAEFARRLSLDMSHVFTAGIPFDTIDGELQLADNVLQIDEVEVRGRSSQFSLDGTADVRAGTMQAQLAVTLPVANNLPWVAALVGGLPVAAGVFVVSKLFEKQMDRLASAVYRIEGPWTDPRVEFTRIFDNETRREIRREDLEAAVEAATATDLDAPTAPEDDAPQQSTGEAVEPVPDGPLPAVPDGR
jgi:uncharacterized protein (TIGR02099 family)